MGKRTIANRKYKIVKTEPAPPHKKRTAMQKFVTGKKPNEKDIKKLIHNIQGMITEARTRADIVDGYRKSPEQMLKDGKIKVIFRDSGKHFGKTAKYGCYQMSSIFYSALKEMGLSPKMTRFFIAGTPHTTVLFRLNGRLYEADLFEGMFHDFPSKSKKGKVATTDTPSIQKVGEHRRKEIGELLSKGKMKFIKPGQYTKQMYDRERRSGKLAV